jgi:hypothetical protein
MKRYDDIADEVFDSLPSPDKLRKSKYAEAEAEEDEAEEDADAMAEEAAADLISAIRGKDSAGVLAAIRELVKEHC